ncbi:MAG TPA: N-acylglucosamine 2-epimerase [Leeuwenhoekiella sp.]|nr:N-acylglucosamine 2-epimerase [Leeuwenhoekiella sp.]
MKLSLLFFLAIFATQAQEKQTNPQLIKSLEKAAHDELLNKWYPLAVDQEDGGFYSDITYDFKLGENQDKMIVTQARHVWVNSVAAMRYSRERTYLNYATHGFEFLRDKMWDKKNGGFYTLVTKKGERIPRENEEKTAYGNAFAIYGLSAYYEASGNEEALDLAKKTFHWLEEHSHDSIYKGYYQSLALDGTPIQRTADFPSTSEAGYKDQNSSIHLLEAMTELYHVWPDTLVKTRLEELFFLVRDTIVNEDHYMNLFFTKDWKPVTFNTTSRENIKKHYYLDHVSFGHDVETAYLLLEASEALGRTDTETTLKIGKDMVDHSLATGFDTDLGGFYDGGYYFEGKQELEIVNDDKNWWSQAEGLNTLLLMQSYFPQDDLDYQTYFDKLWMYVQTYFMDAEHGGWYEWGIDKRPETKTALKGQIWKATYHNFRALINCIDQLEGIKNRE